MTLNSKWPRLRIASRAQQLRVLVTSVTLLLVVGCSAKVDGTYRGVVKNESYDVSADLFLNLQDNEGFLSGTMTIGAPLAGGGSVSGSRNGKNFQFTTSDGAGGKIVWIGQVRGGTIGGRYVVEPSMLGTLVAGADKQEGAWIAKR